MSNKNILKATKTLQYLLEGGEIKIEEDIYVMDEDNNICMKGTIEKGKKDTVDIVYLPIYMSLKDFIDLCETMSDEKYFFMTAGKTLFSMCGKKY